ncbi:MAG: histidinol dehydrogenase [Armatimonas sp.]
MTDSNVAFVDRLHEDTDAAEKIVADILADVRLRGDEAVLELTRRFDYSEATVLQVPAEAIDAAAERVAQTPLWGALQAAAERIRTFHQKQLRQSWMDFSQPGEALGQRIVPLKRVGVYVPGGRAAYPSTVLMAGIPALVAGVKQVALTTPPSKETGFPPDATLAAAKLAGFTEVYAMGGAQAIGALAYGTKSVRAVDKIVGPGNIYANLAKKLVFGTVGIEMLAGPSEVGVLFDDTTNPHDVALETICQIEHDPANRALLVTPSRMALEAVQAAIESQLQDLPRADIVRQSLTHSFGVVTESLADAIRVVNDFAPEHLHILTSEPWTILPQVENAGAILLGPNSRAALGDYMFGPSHTLPTGGCARYASPLNVDDFVKKQSVIWVNSVAAAALSDPAATIATFEGLEGHARSARG